MNLPRITTEEEWLAARETLRAAEEKLLEARDGLSSERRRLPMVEINKDYAFEGPQGRVRLPDLFAGRQQLMVYHFWFEPGEQACAGCSLWVSNLGQLTNLHERDTTLVMVSRASSAEIEATRERRGWTVPWFSPIGTEFNDDNRYVGEPQITVFVQHDDRIFRTYSISGRILETISNHWTLLDLTPRGA